MMDKFKKIQSVLLKNDITILKGQDLVDVICLPYEGIKDKNNRMFIYLIYDKKEDVLTYFLIEQINPDFDMYQIKSKLFDIDSHNLGSFEILEDNTFLLYQIYSFLNQGEFSFKNYKVNILDCIKTYEDLKEKNIILWQM